MTQAALPADNLAGKWAQKIAHALYLDNKECEAVYDYLQLFVKELIAEAKTSLARKESRSGE